MLLVLSSFVASSDKSHGEALPESDPQESQLEFVLEWDVESSESELLNTMVQINNMYVL